MTINNEDMSYFETKRFKRILSTYEQAVEAQRSVYMDADELTDIAEYYAVNQQHDKANQAIALALRLHPGSTDPQVFVARQEMMMNHIDEAFALCDDIDDQTDREVVFLRAELLIRDYREQEAVQLLEDSYYGTDDKEAYLADTVALLIDYNLWPEAHDWCERMKAECPNSISALVYEAEILIFAHQFAEAIHKLEHILDTDPYQIHAWDLLAEAQCTQSLYAEAIESCEYALAIAPNDYRAQAVMGNCHYQLGHYDKAHHYFELSLQTAPDDVIHQMDAICLFKMGLYEQASEKLGVVIRMVQNDAPRQTFLTMQQALVEAKLHHTDRATQLLDEVGKTIDNDSDIEDFELVYAQVMMENHNMEQCKKHFRQALRHSDNPDKTAVVIGIAFWEKGYFEEAVKMLATVVKTPHTDEAHYALPYLAYCYMSMGKMRLYLSTLKKAIDCSPELTQEVFADVYPHVPLSDYYPYAYRDTYGHYPFD